MLKQKQHYTCSKNTSQDTSSADSMFLRALLKSAYKCRHCLASLRDPVKIPHLCSTFMTSSTHIKNAAALSRAMPEIVLPPSPREWPLSSTFFLAKIPLKRRNWYKKWIPSLFSKHTRFVLSPKTPGSTDPRLTIHQFTFDGKQRLWHAGTVGH